MSARRPAPDRLSALRDLSGHIAHDLNNLLMVLQGRTEFVLDSLPPGHPLRRHATLIQETVHRAQAISQALLAFSGQQLLELKLLDLNAVITGLAPALRKTVGAGIELRLALDRAVKRVRADPARIEEAITNLVLNARDAMDQGGRLTLATANWRIDRALARRHVGARAGNFVVLTVTDTGRGMSPKVLTRLFEPFFTTKTRPGPTGLGLAVTYGIVTQHQGCLLVDSRLGRGTTFRMCLPPISRDGGRRAVAAPA